MHSTGGRGASQIREDLAVGLYGHPDPRPEEGESLVQVRALR
jgi:hypothetical protein